MAFRICEDVGTTKRRKMTPSRALKIWEAHGGKCLFCRLLIDGAREDWYVEHIRALELGGEDTDENCAPAHYYHKPEKDAEDHSLAARAKRQKRALLGIKKPKGRPLPGSRASGIRRRMDGTIERWSK